MFNRTSATSSNSLSSNENDLTKALSEKRLLAQMLLVMTRVLRSSISSCQNCRQRTCLDCEYAFEIIADAREQAFKSLGFEEVSDNQKAANLRDAIGLDK
jgi:hypothetical protein